MIGLTDNKGVDRDYYCFCDSDEIDHLEFGDTIIGDIYINHFDPKTRKLYKHYQRIALQIVADPSVPEVKKINNILHFFIPQQYFSSFRNNYACAIRYDISGNKLQIMDYTKCKYRLCTERDDILQYCDITPEMKAAEKIPNEIIDRDFVDKKDLGYKSIKDMTDDYLRLKMRHNDD